jgi:antitoxin (DNA-binding transcriptional repressor) of toxin-antitoxin stability system
MQVSIRELKAQLSSYINAAKAGHSVIITSHKKVVAELKAITVPSNESIGEIPGVIWNGEKPTGGRRHPEVSGQSLSDTVLEMR